MRGGRGIIVALFLIINILMMISCGNGGPELKEGEAVTADGRSINLVEASEKIKAVSSFVVNVKEIEALVGSIINGIAKGIQQKITASGLAADSGATTHNTPLLAGAYKVAEIIEQKSKALQVTEFIKSLESKINAVTAGAAAFVKKLKDSNAELGATGGTATHTNAKKAIDVNDSPGDKGASDLKALNTAIDDLLNAANEILRGTIREIKEPAKINTNKAN